ncbi:hypothetical protein ACFL6X_04855 [Candidatus Latescibacterota bacterium]
MKVRRLPDNPIIVPHMGERMGDNINGPSLIRVPEWVPGRLGEYYLYFAHHGGTHIRLAYADALAGPWRVYEPGVLALEDAFFSRHIASPDIHVDEGEKRLRMYYHGPEPGRGQMTRAALSEDGLSFQARPELISPSYFRAFDWEGMVYGMSMPGIFFRSADGLTGFEQGPTLFGEHLRHGALKLDGHRLSVFHTCAGDTPERILLSTIDLKGDWQDWQASEAEVVLEPELEYEGADLPLEPSRRGAIRPRARQLRDPCIYREGDRTYLLYAVAGEHGIAIAELEE